MAYNLFLQNIRNPGNSSLANLFLICHKLTFVSLSSVVKRRVKLDP